MENFAVKCMGHICEQELLYIAEILCWPAKNLFKMDFSKCALFQRYCLWTSCFPTLEGEIEDSILNIILVL